MKKVILILLGLFMFSSLISQDDIYFKGSVEEWSTDVNDDWDVDVYNRRRKKCEQTSVIYVDGSIALFAYRIRKFSNIMLSVYVDPVYDGFNYWGWNPWYGLDWWPAVCPAVNDYHHHYHQTVAGPLFGHGPAFEPISHGHQVQSHGHQVHQSHGHQVQSQGHQVYQRREHQVYQRRDIQVKRKDNDIVVRTHRNRMTPNIGNGNKTHERIPNIGSESRKRSGEHITRIQTTSSSPVTRQQTTAGYYRHTPVGHSHTVGQRK